MSKYTAIYDAVKERFPDAQFSVSCFESIKEIETKVLNDSDDYIIFTDTYKITYLERKNRHLNKKYKYIEGQHLLHTFVSVPFIPLRQHFTSSAQYFYAGIPII